MSTPEFSKMVVIIIASNDRERERERGGGVVVEGGTRPESNYDVPFPPLIPCTSFMSATNY
jgi:hypothetical protein